MLACNGSGEISLGEIVDYINLYGTGGILWAATESIPAGHIKTINGVAYMCTTTHTSVVGDLPNGDPTQPNQVNWVPITGTAIPKLNYIFNSSSDAGPIPPAVPAGPHDTEFGPDGTTTGTPDETGPYYYSIASPTTATEAEVYVNGFKVPGDEYTIIDGYIHLDSAVSLNSQVQITI